MSVDAETWAVYDAQASEYARVTEHAVKTPDLPRFLAHIPPNGAVLDLGCGPGLFAAAMQAKGVLVTGWDVSDAMLAEARARGVMALAKGFDDLGSLAPDSLHGVWANFSLLHAPRAELPRHLKAIARALKPAGVLHITMKTGENAARDRLGRLYTYVTVAELHGLLAQAGLTLTASRLGADTGLDGTVSDWVSCLAQRP